MEYPRAALFLIGCRDDNSHLIKVGRSINLNCVVVFSDEGISSKLNWIKSVPGSDLTMDRDRLSIPQIRAFVEKVLGILI